MEPRHEKYEELEREIELLKRQLNRKKVELEAVLAQTEELRFIDTLTNLPNRRKIIADFQREVQRSNRYRTPLSISIIDIDHFKLVNDRYGHPAGDEVLRFLTNILRQAIRDPDEVGRLAGEEFLIILPNSNLAAASRQADRLCSLVRANSTEIDLITVSITISVGIAEFRLGKESSEDLLKRGDAALYRAKRNGRDRWCTAA